MTVAMTTAMPMPSPTEASGMSGMMSSIMSNTFDTTTTVTLLFSGWTTRTPLQYFSALIFLFFLTLLNRFLGAWRTQLSRVWANQAAKARIERSRKLRLERLGKYGRQPMGNISRASTAISRDINWEEENDVEMELLSPATVVEEEANYDGSHSPKGIAAEQFAASTEPNKIEGKEHQSYSRDRSGSTTLRNHSHHQLRNPELEELDLESGLLTNSVPGPTWTRLLGSGRWQAGNPLSWKIDAPRALLEFARAGIGYVL
jgi:hypothetical protein